MLNPTKKSCQNLLRVWHSVIIRVDLSKKTPCVFLRSFDDVNIVAGRTTGTMEVTQSVQRWVMNSNWQESMCSFRWPKVSWSTPRARATTSPPQEEDSQASNLEICGVYVQRAGGRLVHLMSDPVSWLWLNLCRDSWLIFSLTSGNVGRLGSKGGGCSNTPSVLTGLKSWWQSFQVSRFFQVNSVEEMTRQDDSCPGSAWNLKDCVLKFQINCGFSASRSLFFASPKGFSTEIGTMTSCPTLTVCKLQTPVCPLSQCSL